MISFTARLPERHGRSDRAGELTRWYDCGHAERLGSGQLKFLSTPLEGVKVLEGSPHWDQRGAFRRLWCQREYAEHGPPKPIVQVSLSHTLRQGTLRGMHFQLPPSREDKLVHCVKGRIYDVALDLRPSSRSYLRHFGIELAESEPQGLFIPAGCAHGFMTLTDDCDVLYMMTDFYDPALSSGVRWDDPAFSISWPERPRDIIGRDAEYPDFDPGTVRGFAEY